ncbi:hypothetical protein ECC01_18840 [Bacillus tequilensis]|nr:hypothetical protein [Bacillus tequilensis]
MGGSYLSDLCSMYQKDKFFTGFVPEELLTYACELFPLSKKETVTALLNCSMGSKAKSFVMFTSKGLYWKRFGEQEGCVTWEAFTDIQSIKSTDDYEIWFDGVEAFDVGFSSYPADLLAELLRIIQQFLSENGLDLLTEPRIDHVSVSASELREISILFQNSHDKMFGLTNGLLVGNEISEKREVRLRKRLHIPKDQEMISFWSTFPVKQTDGITLTDKGIYFSDPFLRLFYPWHVFKETPVMLKDQELIVGKKNVIQLLENLMPAKDVFAFLEQVKRRISAVTSW